MRPNNLLYSGFPITPTKSHPTLLAEISRSGFYLRGVFFVGNTILHAVSRQSSTLNEAELCDGAYLIDHSHLPRVESVAETCGPMPDVLLPPMTIERWINRRITFSSVNEALEYDRLLKPFTLISLDLYEVMWKGLNARIGRRLGNRTVWDLHKSIGAA